MTTERKYSVADINRMRVACRALWACSIGTTTISLEQQRNEGEEMLRTYIMAGTDPDELCAAANEEQRRHDRAMEELSELYRETAVKFAEPPKRKRIWRDLW